ncbi:unnamed protein product [Anisakis simplex]|uniref:MFS domain-containing protein n=1 Tax=Anisakis simplex TaxID=6269 RepID=A0A0M3K1Z7_ANISI|nr:unnamed protein product [Anisakis simplex]
MIVLFSDTHKQNGVSESARYTSSTINESSNGKCASRFTSKKTPRNLTIVQPTVTESSPNTPSKGLTVDLSSASFAGGMPRTPLTPSTIFNFELPHSPGLPHSPAYVDSRPRAFSFGKVHTPLVQQQKQRPEEIIQVSIPTTLEEVIEDSDSTSKKSFVQSEEARTNWRSIWIMAFILFLVKMQFSVYYATVWPFLQEMDPTATTTFYGFMTASYSLGAALSAPLFGYWSNKMKQIKLPAVTGIVVMFMSNLCFMFIEFIPTNRKYFLLLARLGHGIGIGASILLQTYSAIASANKDKSTAAAISDGAYCLGLAFGPAFEIIPISVFQLVFAPLGYPGISIGPLAISMYTAPAYAANAMVLLALFFIIFIFNEQLTETLSEENSENGQPNSFEFVSVLILSMSLGIGLLCSLFNQTKFIIHFR